MRVRCKLLLFERLLVLVLLFCLLLARICALYALVCYIFDHQVRVLLLFLPLLMRVRCKFGREELVWSFKIIFVTKYALVCQNVVISQQNMRRRCKNAACVRILPTKYPRVCPSCVIFTKYAAQVRLVLSIY